MLFVYVVLYLGRLLYTSPLLLTLSIDISSHLSVLTCILILVLLLLYHLFGFIVLLMCSFDAFFGILLNAHFDKAKS